MDNSNNRDYLEKIKTQVIENLKRTAFAPSVQMTDVPRDPEGMDEDAEAALDDLDEDQNRDSRHSRRQWDKYVERPDELSESEPEDDLDAKDPRKQGGRGKRRNFANYRNLNARPEADGGFGTLHMNGGNGMGLAAPQATGGSPPVSTDAPVEDAINSASASQPEAASGDALTDGPPRLMNAADADGDVEMEDGLADPAPAPSGAPVLNHQITTPPMSPAAPAAALAAGTSSTPPTQTQPSGTTDDVGVDGESTFHESAIAAAEDIT